jgi:hypothetical protein
LVGEAWARDHVRPGTLVLVDNGHRVLPYFVRALEAAREGIWLRLDDLPEAFVAHVGAIQALDGSRLTVNRDQEALEKLASLIGGVVTDEASTAALSVGACMTDRLVLAGGREFPPDFGRDLNGDGEREFRVYDLAVGDAIRTAPATWLRRVEPSDQGEASAWEVRVTGPTRLTWLGQIGQAIEACLDDGSPFAVEATCSADCATVSLVPPSTEGRAVRLVFR